MYNKKIMACFLISMFIMAVYCEPFLDDEDSEEDSLLVSRELIAQLFARAFGKRSNYSFSITLRRSR